MPSRCLPRDDGPVTRGSRARRLAGYTAGRSAIRPRLGSGASRPTPRSFARRCADRPADWRGAAPAPPPCGPPRGPPGRGPSAGAPASSETRHGCSCRPPSMVALGLVPRAAFEILNGLQTLTCPNLFTPFRPLTATSGALDTPSDSEAGRTAFGAGRGAVELRPRGLLGAPRSVRQVVGEIYPYHISGQGNQLRREKVAPRCLRPPKAAVVTLGCGFPSQPA